MYSSKINLIEKELFSFSGKHFVSLSTTANLNNPGIHFTSIKNNKNLSIATFIFKSLELFIKKMKKAKIFNILKTITGRKKFDVIGLFPGEKVHEELLSANEYSFCFESDDYYIVKPGKSNPNPLEIFSTLNASEYSDDELKVLLNYSN